jgi:hypothetical protein
MELVPGVPITRYCDELNLPIRERLELFVPVCRAVQHAHQKGIIHRDIKPSNVLVCLQDGKPIAKVIDFGVAKAINQRLTEGTFVTEFGAVVGTLEYMAPEQAEMSPLGVDTRADVYALGVLLYELLTGSTPLDKQRLRQAAYTEMVRMLKEEEPPRPSTRLSESKELLPNLAAQRRTEPAKLAKEVRGELDWIVMRALEKDRTRRYETPSGLGRDVQRYLADEPVEACPPSGAYRLRKFLRKHRAAVAVAAGFALVVLLGLLMSTAMAFRALRAQQMALRARDAAEQARDAELRQREQAVAERRRAEASEDQAKKAEQEAKAVLEFIENRVFAAARPEGQEGGLGKDVTLRKGIDAALPGIAEAFKDQPLVEASLRLVLAETYRYLGEVNLAIREGERALELRQAKLGPEHPDTLVAMNNLALAYKAAGKLDRAVPLLEVALRHLTTKLGPGHADTLAAMNNLATAYQAAGKLEQAIPLLEQGLERQRAKSGPDDPGTLRSMNNLGEAYRAARKLDQALPLLEQTLQRKRVRLGAEHPETLQTMNNLALAYQDAGKLDRAVPLLEQTLQLHKAKLGADHPSTLTNMSNLAVAYRQAGKLDQAVPLLEQVVQLRKAKLGAEHPDTIQTMNVLAKWRKEMQAAGQEKASPGK